MFGLPALSVRPPDPDRLAAARRDSDGQGLSYDAVGATREGTAPPGFVADDDEIVLGRGRALFERASDAVARWTMFDLPWVRLVDRPPPAPGVTIAFASRQVGLWAVHTCRVVYRVDEPDRFGFAYGTLQTHAIRGEERFLVRHDPRTDEVTFGIFKFSAPAVPAMRALGALTRHLQRRFSVEACEAVRRACVAPPAVLGPHVPLGSVP